MISQLQQLLCSYFAIIQQLSKLFSSYSEATQQLLGSYSATIWQLLNTNWAALYQLCSHYSAALSKKYCFQNVSRSNVLLISCHFYRIFEVQCRSNIVEIFTRGSSLLKLQDLNQNILSAHLESIYIDPLHVTKASWRPGLSIGISEAKGSEAKRS